MTYYDANGWEREPVGGSTSNYDPDDLAGDRHYVKNLGLFPAPPEHHLDVNALLPGQKVWSKGANEFGDGRLGGMVVRYDDDQDTGERFVQIVTRSLTTPPPGRLYLSAQKGRGYVDLGPLARMHRLAVADIAPDATDGFRHAKGVWDMAIQALRASSVPPANHLGSRLHDDLFTAYRTLREVAQELQRAAVA